MKYFLLTLCFSVLLINIHFAQQKTIKEIRKELKESKAKFPGKQPMYAVNGKLRTTLAYIDTLSIFSINALTVATAIKTYGIKAKNGVIEVEILEIGSVNQEGPIIKEDKWFEESPVPEKPNPTTFNDRDRIYSMVEINPVFDGNFKSFLEKNLRYPNDAVDAGIQGDVLIRFIINTDGSISDVMLSENSPQKDITLTQESIRIIKKSNGKWKPAFQNGTPVRSYHEQMIRYVTAQEEDNSSNAVFYGFDAFVDSAMKYPKQALKKKINGTISLKFKVSISGTVSEVVLSETSAQKDPLLVKEAMRIIHLTNGRWIPSTYNGEKVPQELLRDIIFKLKKK